MPGSPPPPPSGSTVTGSAYIGTPYGHHPDDDCPSTPVVPPKHGAGHHMPPLRGATRNGTPFLGRLGSVPLVGASSLASRIVVRQEGGKSGRNQLWEPAVLEQWAAMLRAPSMQRGHMECSGLHTLGTEYVRHITEESIRVWYAHAKAQATLLKAPGP